MRIAPCSNCRKVVIPASLVILLLQAPPELRASSDPIADGTIVSSEVCTVATNTKYDDYVATRKKMVEDERAAAEAEGHRYTTEAKLLTREEFEARAKADARIECRRLRYMSDGLQVVAYEWKPAGSGGEKRPLIIFNRGGNRDFSIMTPSSWPSRFALDGFVVLASQYRGSDGGEGTEEFGGADVRDVLNLIPLAESLGYVDMDNVFMLGWSRGGMMTALALKHGMQVNAAVLGSPLTDLIDEAENRPLVARRVWSQLIPGYADRRDEVLRERSAMYWPEKLRVPLMILQGGADWRVDPAVTLDFARALQAAGATYELIVYAGDDHAISANSTDSRRRIVEWFRRHMRPESTPPAS